MKQKIRSRIVLLLPLCWVVIGLLLLPVMGWAQAAPAKPKKPLLDFGGQVGLYTDIYWTSDSSLSSRLMQRETVVQRFQASARLNVWKFKIPINLNLGTPMSRLGDFEIPRPNLKQVFLNQRNGAALHPTIGKLTYHIGSHTFKASRMTAGNIPFATGLGLDYKSKNLRIAASYGITQALVQRDSARRIAGQYQREMAGFQFAVGNDKANQLMVNYVRARDMALDGLNGTQIPKNPRLDGGIASLGWRLKLFKTFYWQNEVGISIFSRDADAPQVELGLIDDTGRLEADYGQYLSLAKRFFPINFASTPGYAVNTKAGFKREKWDLGVKGDYANAGYKSLAYFNQQTDRLDLTLDGNVHLFKERLFLHAGGGGRRNNVSLTPYEPPSKVSSNQELIYEGSVTATLFKALYINSSYSNLGFQTVRLPRLDSLIDSVAQRQRNSSLAFNPSLSLGKRIVHSLSANFNREVYKDFDEAKPDSIATHLQTIVVGFTHQITFPKALGVTFGFNHVQNEVQKQWNAQAGLQSAWLKNKLRVMAQIQVGGGTGDLSGGGSLFSFNLNSSLRLNKSTSGNLMLNLRRQEVFGDPVVLGLIRLKLTYTFEPFKK